MEIKYDGMPKKEDEQVTHPDINDLEMIGYIMESTQDRNLTFNDVKAILQAETDYLEMKGFIDKPES